jgi:hypothetical protein
MKKFFVGQTHSCAPAFALLLAISLGLAANAQTSKPDAPSAPPESPKGRIIFQSSGESPAESSEKTAPVPASLANELSSAVRSAPFVTAYDLDARIAPATAQLTMRARLTVRNDGAEPLKQIALQISSSLHWESAALISAKGRTILSVDQHVLDTDADHTGRANEVVLTLPAALPPGESVVLDMFYSGSIEPSAARLERIGATASEAEKADWDAIGEDSTALRGFGNVLWYPVASPPLFLGQAAQLFEAVGEAKRKGATATARLRLVVDFAGHPPALAYFCGRRLALKPAGDPAAAGLVNAPGEATAEFAAARIGFRTMSLFIQPTLERLLTPFGDSPTSGALLALESNDDSSVPLVVASARDAAVILQDWLGPQPLSALTIIDQPGQPFEDGPLLVAPLRSLAGPDATPALTHSLTHAWVQSGSPWMDEGLAQFFVLLGVERSRGREAATAQLETLLQPLALAEPPFEAGKPEPKGQPLTSTGSELYYRRKAAAVWWMLRDIAGDEALKQALQAWRVRPQTSATPEQDAAAFESVLEKTTAKNLHWFFDDWVFHDRGLPDLTVVDVTPRELPAAPGKSSGWLIAVTVRNDGAAVADVPVIVRSGTYSTTQRIRVAGFASVTTRVLVEAPPTEVLVNDGTTPEQRSSTHVRAINLQAR